MTLRISNLGKIVSVLGVGRTVLLLALVVANGLCAAVIYGYLGPAQQWAQRNVSSLRGEVATLRTDIRDMRTTLADIVAQKAFFEQIQAQGFFTAQDRPQAEDLLMAVETDSGVVAAKASIKRAEILREPQALKASHVVLQSPIEVEIEALDDLSVWRYISMLQSRFPGYIQMDELETERVGKLDASVLRAIVRGESPILVKARVTFAWYTMVPDSQMATPERGGGM
ncbi:MAG TPA: hypothetical protein DDX54_06555 [Rhodospirillaceae bacterium]|jgi:hypothetical protein|nr:hypothetical protein [Alphaproteobacteria bacterium]HBH27044.1 hypothetical protein [Rhodospirillaceae bacterium]